MKLLPSLPRLRWRESLSQSETIMPCLCLSFLGISVQALTRRSGRRKDWPESTKPSRMKGCGSSKHPSQWTTLTNSEISSLARIVSSGRSGHSSGKIWPRRGFSRKVLLSHWNALIPKSPRTWGSMACRCQTGMRKSSLSSPELNHILKNSRGTSPPFY